jgi:hypothetical protein
MTHQNPPTPAMTHFTAAIFCTAQALETLRHSITIRDDQLSVHASARLRASIAAVDRAFDQLEPSMTDEAGRLAAHLRTRVIETLAGVPAHLSGITAIQHFLERFGARRG